MVRNYYMYPLSCQGGNFVSDAAASVHVMPDR